MIFLKLGGSLITDKSQPFQLRDEALARAAGEIADFVEHNPEAGLLVGHGSGSYGHHAALDHMPDGASLDPVAAGRVWWAARQLHHRVVQQLHEAGLPAMSFPPSSLAVSRGGQLDEFFSGGISQALRAGWIPVVYGDVVLDSELGAVIQSTEAVFERLAASLKPDRLLLCGQEAGVYEDYPDRSRLLPVLRPDGVGRIAWSDAAGADVTGGMAQKVAAGLAMAAAHPGLEVRIFSGAAPGNLRRTLAGEPLGTQLLAAAD